MDPNYYFVQHNYLRRNTLIREDNFIDLGIQQEDLFYDLSRLMM